MTPDQEALLQLYEDIASERSFEATDRVRELGVESMRRSFVCFEGGRWRLTHRGMHVLEDLRKLQGGSPPTWTANLNIRWKSVPGGLP